MAVTTLSNLTNTTDSINNVATALQWAMPYLAYPMFGIGDQVAERKGKNIKWYRHTVTAENTTPLAESPTWAPTTHVVDSVTATLTLYGDGREITEALELQTVFDLRPDLLTWAGESAGKSINAVTRGTLIAGVTTILYPNGKNAGTMATSDTPTLNLFIDAAKVLKNNDAPFFTMGGQQCYVAIISPNVEAYLMKDSTFRTAVQFNESNRLFYGYLATLFGVCFVRSSTATAAQATFTVNCDQSIVTGKAAYAVPSLPLMGKAGQVPQESGIIPAYHGEVTDDYMNNLMDMFRILVTPPGDGNGNGAHGDEWATRFKVAWKAYWTTVILNQNFIVNVRSAA